MIETAILLTSMLAMGAHPEEMTKELEARWRHDYPLAAKDWEAVARHFVAKGQFSFRWNDGSTTTIKDVMAAALGDSRMYVMNQKEANSPKFANRVEATSVQCRTNEYMFTLKKEPLSNNFTIVNFQESGAADESQFKLWYDRFARNATDYFGASVLQRMEHPSFALKSIKSLTQGEGDLVRIEYSYEGKYVFENGFFDLDPKRNWGIRAVDIICKSKKEDFSYALNINVDYEKINDTQFYPKRMESYCKTPRPEVYEHAIFVLDHVTLGEVPVNIFRLPAYGLPDLALRPSSRASAFTFRNPVLWLALALTVVCLALSWFLRSRTIRSA